MDFLTTLNQSQFKAVTHQGGPLFVVAGAGTGKTKTLTSRVAYLILNHVEPKRILALTFTNKAAREMKQRIIDITGPHASDTWLYTFHAFGLQILRRHIQILPYGYRPNFTVIDEDDGKKIVSEQLKLLGLDAKAYSVKALKHLISLYKCKRMEGFERTDEEKIYQKYQDYLKTENLVDFDDLLIYTLELLETYHDIRTHYQHYFSHILVDEFQDTDAQQYKILKLLGAVHKNLFVVGDPDQSIYAFRGANYENNIKFLEEFKAEKVVLDQNYRSTNLILKAANRLINHNINRTTKKQLESDLGLGEAPHYQYAPTDFSETYFVANEIRKLIQQGYQYKDIAILYRNNALSRLFEDTFIKDGLPYMIYGGISFYERKEIKDALAYIRVIINPSQNFYLKRIINIPKRQLGHVSIQKLETKSIERNCSMFDAIEHTDLSNQAKQSVMSFKTMILDLQKDILKMDDLEQMLPHVLKAIGYLDMLKNDNDDTSDDRIRNLMELQTVFTRGDLYYEGSLIEKATQLLDQIALYTDLDKQIDDDNQVILSTYHQVKGLEFKVVFMVVLEEGIFPSDRSLYSGPELEEERRICYVGMTRAMKRLYLSYAEKRMVYGTMKYQYPSRFIKETKEVFDEEIKRPVVVTTDTLLKTGDHVTHQMFGQGIVINVEQEIATIAFSMPHGVKKIIENHPALKKIQN